MRSFYFNFKVHVEQIKLKKNNSTEFLSFYYLVVVEQFILLVHESYRLIDTSISVNFGLPLGFALDTAHDVDKSAVLVATMLSELRRCSY